MTPPRALVLRWAPAVTVAAFALPIVAGLLGTLLPAFGLLPAIGADALEPRRPGASCATTPASELHCASRS